MEWMRTLVEIIHDEIYPFGIRTRAECKLIRVPFVSGKGHQRRRGIGLDLPGCVVEVAEGDVVVAGHLLDLGVDKVGLGCCWREVLQD